MHLIKNNKISMKLILLISIGVNLPFISVTHSAENLLAEGLPKVEVATEQSIEAVKDSDNTGVTQAAGLKMSKNNKTTDGNFAFAEEEKKDKKTEKAKSDNDNTFKPTEAISEDLAVSFPVDI